MGAYQNNDIQAAKKKKTRGKVRNSDRLAAFAGKNGDGSADWGGCDPARIQGVITGITLLGGAVTFGLSRDLGAHSLTLLLDDNRQTLWFNGSADLDAELDSVKATLDTLS